MALDGETPPAETSGAVAAGKYDALIERWFVGAFHGSPHMTDTAAFNHVRKQVDELKKLLAAEEH